MPKYKWKNHLKTTIKHDVFMNQELLKRHTINILSSENVRFASNHEDAVDRSYLLDVARSQLEDLILQHS